MARHQRRWWRSFDQSSHVLALRDIGPACTYRDQSSVRGRKSKRDLHDRPVCRGLHDQGLVVVGLAVVGEHRIDRPPHAGCDRQVACGSKRLQALLRASKVDGHPMTRLACHDASLLCLIVARPRCVRRQRSDGQTPAMPVAPRGSPRDCAAPHDPYHSDRRVERDPQSAPDACKRSWLESAARLMAAVR